MLKHIYMRRTDIKFTLAFIYWKTSNMVHLPPVEPANNQSRYRLIEIVLPEIIDVQDTSDICLVKIGIYTYTWLMEKRFSWDGPRYALAINSSQMLLFLNHDQG
jgi:hypothetical protein